MAFRAGLRDPVFRKLGNIALIGGFVTIGTGLYFESKIKRNILNAPYLKQSLEIMHQNENLIEYLGPPIGIGKIDLGQKDIVTTQTQTQLHLPLTGRHHKGELYLWASRAPSSSDWTIDRIEVSVDDQPGKRILVHEHTEPSADIFASSENDLNHSSF